MGCLIGLRMVTEEPDRFLKVSMGNTGLPYNPDASEELQNKVNWNKPTFMSLHELYTVCGKHGIMLVRK